MHHLSLLPALAFFALAAPALAADPAAPLAKLAAKTLNPNEIVCEYLEELGTRLSGHKVCATRAEWAQRRQDERMGIERGQLLQMGQGR